MTTAANDSPAWETTAVIAPPPGWRAVHVHSEGVWSQPCVAVLVQRAAGHADSYQWGRNQVPQARLVLAVQAEFDGAAFIPAGENDDGTSDPSFVGCFADGDGPNDATITDVLRRLLSSAAAAPKPERTHR